MKRCLSSVVVGVLLATSMAYSQSPEGPAGPPRTKGPGGPGGPGVHRHGGAPGRPMPMHSTGLFALLDADHDGMLNSQEISNAAQVLGGLDRNQDGNVTLSEAFHGMAKTTGASHQRGKRPEAHRPRPERPAFDGADVPRELRERRGDHEGPFGPRMAERLMQLDTDKDGKLSADELPERFARMKDQLDTNDDGFVDSDELKAFGDRMRERRQGDRPQRQKP